METVRENISQPEALENLYRADKIAFKTDFESIYPEIQDSELAKFWKIRLAFDQPEEKTISFNKLDTILLNHLMIGEMKIAF